jgi:hypothetical protein
MSLYYTVLNNGAFVHSGEEGFAGLAGFAMGDRASSRETDARAFIDRQDV